MTNKNLITAALIFGGGFLVFWGIKPMFTKETASGGKKSLDGKGALPAPNQANAEIVLSAYTEALKSGEPASRLTELNKECMQEFGMRCYIESKSGKVIVCDVKGETIMER